MRHRLVTPVTGFAALAGSFGLIRLAAVSVAIASTVPPEFDRAARLVMTDEHAAAISEYQAFLDRVPDDPLAPVAAAAIASLQLDALGDTTASLASIDRMIDRYPESEWVPEVARQKAGIAAARGEWLSAGHAYRRAIDLALSRPRPPRDGWLNDITLSAASCYHEAGDSKAVIDLYSRVLGTAPAPEVAATALYRLGESYEALDDPGAAARHYARVVAEYPQTQALAQTLAKREVIDAHTEVDWAPAEAYVEQTSLTRRGDIAGALALCDSLTGSASAIYRDFGEFRRISFETVLAGDFTEGCRRLEAFIDGHPGSPASTQAEEFLEQRFRPVAGMESQLAATPDDPEILAGLGEAYIQTGATARGIELLEQALARRPDDPSVAMTAGFAYARAQRPEDAVRCFSIYLDRNPEDTTALNMIGYQLLAVGQTDRAITYFERYAEVAPDDPNAHDSLGEGYLNAGRLADAAREYERALEINPEFFNSYLMLGQTYERMGEPEKALHNYRRFLEYEPEGPRADQVRAGMATLEAPIDDER